MQPLPKALFAFAALLLAACNSTNSPTAPQSIEITPSTATVTGGRSVVLGVMGSGGEVISEGIAWRSSNPIVATVDDRGTVLGGYGEGSATITASLQGVSASAIVDLVRLCADLAPLHGEPDASKETQSFAVEYAAGTDARALTQSLADQYGFTPIQSDSTGFSAELTPAQAAGVGCARAVVGMTYL